MAAAECGRGPTDCHLQRGHQGDQDRPRKQGPSEWPCALPRCQLILGRRTGPRPGLGLFISEPSEGGLLDSALTPAGPLWCWWPLCFLRKSWCVRVRTGSLGSQEGLLTDKKSLLCACCALVHLVLGSSKERLSTAVPPGANSTRTFWGGT